LIGMDDDQIGEFVQDFVEVRRAYDEWANVGTSSFDRKEDKVENGNTPTAHVYAAGDRHALPDRGVHSSERVMNEK
ncbi:16262_t:CDS:1, partial [Acaulospora colombiana]